MTTSPQAPPRSRVTAGTIAAAGVAFVAYPIIRPYDDETALAGAESVASGRWIASHTLAMISFGLLSYGLIRLAGHLRGATFDRPARIAATCMAVGTALVLPYYGAETFGLYALAEEAVRTGDLQLLEAFDTVRYSAVAAATFLVGLILIGAAGVYGARALIGLAGGRSTSIDRWKAGLFAAGWVLLLPQFFTPPAARIGHGVLVLVGCALAALTVQRELGDEG